METQPKLNISHSDLDESNYSLLESKVRLLIQSNPIARELYAQLTEVKSVQSYFKSSKSSSDRLRKKFQNSLINSYLVAKKMGFEIENSGFELSWDKVCSVLGIKLTNLECYDERIEIALSKRKFKPYQAYASFYSPTPPRRTSRSEDISCLFDILLNGYYQGKSIYGDCIRRITNLDQDIAFFLDNRQKNLDDLCGE